MDDVIEGVLVTVKALVIIFISSIKSFIPNGILPRKDVRDQVVLITGAGSGIGRLMAYEFGKLGAKLILWDVNEKGNTETQQHLESNGVEVKSYTLDLSDRHQIKEVADRVKSEVGRVDILVNNAGIVTGKKLFDCPDELMEKTIAVNTMAPIYATKHFLPAMLEANRGHIVTIASMAGKAGVAGLVDYCASKHGAVGFNDSLSSEIYTLKKDVKTTVVCPFYINTGMFDGAQTTWPSILPMLEPDYVVQCIMEAVLTNRPLVAIPRFTYIFIALAGLLPSEVINMYGEYFGVTASMNHFTGRKPQSA